MNKYYIKKLIKGEAIGQLGTFVAVPDYDYNRRINYNDDEPFVVEYKGKTQEYANWKEAVTYRHFKDKLLRGTYRLGYFRWDE